jgi:hypothetical protein
MRLISTILPGCLLALTAWAGGTPVQLLPKVPVRFEANRGQFHSAKGAERVLWAARGLGYAVGFTRNATLFRSGTQAIAMRLRGQNGNASFEPSAPLSAPTNYFIPGFRGSVQDFGRLRRHDVYPGIDLVYYGNADHLEYDFEIAAGADPSSIRMHFDGASPRIAPNGDLLLGSRDHVITQHLPVVYQTQANGARVLVPASYRLAGQREVTIALASYDATAPLVIDPVIEFTAYAFGSSGDSGVVITHDAQGFIYVAGNTQSSDFGIASNGEQTAQLGTQNTFLIKLNPAPTAGNPVVIYSSLYGGGTQDNLTAMTTDSNGWIYIAGYTTSTNLVMTNSYQAANAGNTDGFVAVFDPSQSGSASLLYSTYLGGLLADQVSGITVANKLIYVTGSTLSQNYPVSTGAFQAGLFNGWDTFLTVLNILTPGTSSLVISTYFGGSGDDFGRSVAVDPAGNIYIAGMTYSKDLPISPAPYQSTYAGAGDAFLTKYDPTVTYGLYSTYLGGSGTDDARKILIDPQGRVALTGYSNSVDFAITQNAEQPFLGGPGATNAYLTLLDTSQTYTQGLVYSTYFGGSVAEVAYDVKVDTAGVYYFGGYSMSPDMPVTANALNPAAALAGGLNGFVAAIKPSLPPFNSLRYASFITGRPIPALVGGPGSQIVNGVDVDASGAIYLTGWATADIFPPGYAVHTTAPGNPDAFIWVFTPDSLP